MQGVENPSQEASALPLVAAVGLNWVKKSASGPLLVIHLINISHFR